jgi:hypothetical protein
MRSVIHLAKKDSAVGLCVAACLLLSARAAADPLHAIDAGAFQHHDSSWVFSKEVAGFTRVGAPQDIDGSSDVVAYYARVENGTRTTVAVTIHAEDSAAAATLTETQVAMQRELNTPDSTSEWIQSGFPVGKQPALRAIKSVYASASDATSTQASLYFVDTGAWTVQIRASASPLELQSRALDDFARQQLWESLGLSDQTCTGAACTSEAR